MSNVEIYDSSNSQLSSDEYSHDEDDDALMDVAVRKQQQTPSKSVKSNEPSPAKSDESTATTPRKLSTDLNLDAGGTTTKPPASREHTERQIRQMQRNSKAHMYFKRRSIKWLNQRLLKKPDYLSELKDAMPKYQAQIERMTEYRAAKRAIEQEQLARRAIRRDATPSRSQSRSGTQSRSRSPSRSRAGSGSPELICLDDTENEDSPEKPTEPPANNYSQDAVQLAASKTPPSLALQLDVQTEAAPVLNGSVLDEFLTIKRVQAAVCVEQLLEQPDSYKIESAIAAMPLEEATLKRRRSTTPPTAEIKVDKRNKYTVESDEDFIEFLPVQRACLEQPTPQPAAPPMTMTLQKAAILTDSAATARLNDEPLPSFKMGSPFTLNSSAGLEFFEPKKALCQEQQQPENLTAMSYSLETPTPPVEAMDIVYPNLRSEGIKTALPVCAQPEIVQQQATLEAPIFDTPYNLQHEQLLQQPQQQQQLLQQQQQQQTPQSQEPVLSKQRLDASSRQTQTSDTPQPPPRNKSSVDMNNKNSDAIFHGRIRELYTELDEIMNNKVRSIKPELKSLGDARMLLEQDMKTLDNLMAQKQQEFNRLLHMRCAKEELRVRIEREERELIMKEVLPPILNKNCSNADLHEMGTLLNNELNAPMPSRSGPSAMERILNKIENNLDGIKILRSVLGIREKPPTCSDIPLQPPPPQQYVAPQGKRYSGSSMHRPVPPAADDRSSVYERYNLSRQPSAEELSLTGNRNRPETSRFKELIRESRQVTNSEPDLTPSSSYRNQPQQSQQLHQSQRPLDTRHSHPNSLGNHFDNETSIKPLYNSSPLAPGRQLNQRKFNDTNLHYNDIHSNNRSGRSGLETIGQAFTTSNQNHNNNAINRPGATANGPEELERHCQHCGRSPASFNCGGCLNEWYCSRVCVLSAWKTHGRVCNK